MFLDQAFAHKRKFIPRIRFGIGGEDNVMTFFLKANGEAEARVVLRGYDKFHIPDWGNLASRPTGKRTPGRSQKTSFRANWICRESRRVDVITP